MPLCSRRARLFHAPANAALGWSPAPWFGCRRALFSAGGDHSRCHRCAGLCQRNGAVCAGRCHTLVESATLLLTGALHEDGLADCCDAFGGGRTPADVLRIMRDSRIGAFGAIGIVMALMLKWQTLMSLTARAPSDVAITMIAAHAASRTAAMSYLITFDYVRPMGKAKPV